MFNDWNKVGFVLVHQQSILTCVTEVTIRCKGHSNEKISQIISNSVVTETWSSSVNLVYVYVFGFVLRGFFLLFS